MAAEEEASPTLDSLLAHALEASGGASPQDAVLVALHSSLLSAGFVCVASGDEGYEDGANDEREAVSTPKKPGLPVGWNALHEICLQYRHKATGQKCLVKAIPLANQLIISAVAHCHSNKVYTLTLSPLKYVKVGATYDKPSVFVNPLELISTLKGEIEVKLSRECEQYPGASQVTSQSLKSQCRNAPEVTPGSGDPNPHFPDPLRPSRPDPLAIRDPLRIGPSRPYGDPDPLGEFGPFGYGDRDRLPGIGGGGGMIFDPRHNRRGEGSSSGFGPLGPYPPGHPPGARFDPISPLRPPIRPLPPHPGRNPPGAGQYGPSPDHLPPPGYDDMFS